MLTVRDPNCITKPFDPMRSSIKNSQVHVYSLDLAIDHITLISINVLAQDNDSFTTYQDYAWSSVIHPPTSAFHYLTS